jgi:diguanylate cyclase (GGDEF)-like protein/PAS domain S-box-containing protein
MPFTSRRQPTTSGYATTDTRFSRHAWWLYLALMAAIAVLYLAGPLDRGPVFNGIGFSGVIAIVIGVRTHKPAARLAWYLIAAGQAFFVAGDVLSYNYSAFFGGTLPFPSIADAVYLAGVYPCTVAGLLLLIRRRNPGRDLASLTDAMIVTIGLALLSWVFLISPYAHDAALHLGTRLVSMAYPLGDILLLGVAVRMAVGGGRRDPAYYMMISAISAVLVTDSIYGWIQLHGSYTPGDPLDGGWILYYVLFGAAALHPSMKTLSNAAAKTVKVTRVRIIGISVAALIAPVVEILKTSTRGASDAIVIGGATIVIFGLVVVRMIGLVRAEQTAAMRERDLRESVLRTASEVRLGAMVQHSSDVILLLSSDTAVEYASPSVRRVLGYDAAEFIGRRFVDAVPEENQALVESALGGLAHTSAPPEPFELRFRHGDGRLLHTECRFTDLLTQAAVGGIVVNLRDITERKQLDEQLTYQAFHDPVTGLANRALFQDRVAHALSVRGDFNRCLAVLFLDLDDFKTINDTFGHDAGDGVLRTISTRLRSALREGDTAARLGGDEFAVLLEDVPNEAGVSEIVADLLELISAPLCLDAQEASVECSIGIAVVHPTRDSGASTTVDDLLRNADVAMYQAKTAGGNAYCHFSPEMQEAVVEHLALRADLKAAIAADELTLAYQPIFDLEVDGIAGYEALLRWEHPVRGSVSPATFIPVAEHSGLIVPLGRWVLERACADAVRFQKDDPYTRHCVLSVNISAQQLARAELVDEVRNALGSSGLDPHRLMLEITESLLISDVQLAIERLSALRELGVQIAIDDFGTGYSSLSYILQLPIDVLKIDKRFIDSVDSDDKESRLTATIIGLARTLDLRCIAEGIERPSQHERLKELDCDYAQGFLLARPMSSHALQELLTASTPALAALR